MDRVGTRCAVGHRLHPDFASRESSPSAIEWFGPTFRDYPKTIPDHPGKLTRAVNQLVKTDGDDQRLQELVSWRSTTRPLEGDRPPIRLDATHLKVTSGAVIVGSPSTETLGASC